MSPRHRSWWCLPVALAFGGLTISLLLANVGPEKCEAWVSGPIIATPDGATAARVGWRDGNGESHFAFIEIPNSEAPRLSIVVSGDEVRALEGWLIWPNPVTVATLAAVGALLGIVIRFSRRPRLRADGTRGGAGGARFPVPG